MEGLNELATALSKFQGKMKVVEFDSANPYYKSKYASLAALIKSASPILSECGLAVSQLIGEGGAVTTLLLHTSGQALSTTIRITPAKEDAQGIGSAITYARRYSYASILGLVSDEDDDANAASNLKNGMKPETKAPQVRVAEPPKASQTGNSAPNKGIVAKDGFQDSSYIRAKDETLDEIETLGICAFSNKRSKFLEWLGGNYGVEWVDELSPVQKEKAIKELKKLCEEKAKENKR